MSDPEEPDSEFIDELGQSLEDVRAGRTRDALEVDREVKAMIEQARKRELDRQQGEIALK